MPTLPSEKGSSSTNADANRRPRPPASASSESTHLINNERRRSQSQNLESLRSDNRDGEDGKSLANAQNIHDLNLTLDEQLRDIARVGGDSKKEGHDRRVSRLDDGGNVRSSTRMFANGRIENLEVGVVKPHRRSREPSLDMSSAKSAPHSHHRNHYTDSPTSDNTLESRLSNRRRSESNDVLKVDPRRPRTISHTQSASAELNRLRIEITPNVQKTVDAAPKPSSSSSSSTAASKASPREPRIITASPKSLAFHSPCPCHIILGDSIDSITRTCPLCSSALLPIQKLHDENLTFLEHLSTSQSTIDELCSIREKQDSIIKSLGRKVDRLEDDVLGKTGELERLKTDFQNLNTKLVKEFTLRSEIEAEKNKIQVRVFSLESHSNIN